MPAVIEVLVFSGLPNPTFTLDDAQQQALVDLIRPNLATTPVPAQLAVRLGYRGFEWEPPAPLGLAPLLVVGQGLVVGETNGIRTAWVDANGVEEFLKERARAANLGALVDPDRGKPVPPEVIRPEGRRMGLVDELIAGSLDFARTLLAELNSVTLPSVSAFAHAAGKEGFVDNGSVAAQLTIARTQLALVGPKMATGDFAGAATLVATVLAAVDTATKLVGGLPLRDLLIANLHWSGIVPRGLAQQLGLSTVSGPRILELIDGAILSRSEPRRCHSHRPRWRSASTRPASPPASASMASCRRSPSPLPSPASRSASAAVRSQDCSAVPVAQSRLMWWSASTPPMG